MKILHIIFNIDYANQNKQLSFFRGHLVRQIRENSIELSTFEQFKTLVLVLNNSVKCYIWVHPSYGSEIVVQGYESEVTSMVIPELDEYKIEYKKVTRSANMRVNTDVATVNEMHSLISTLKYYSSEQLRQLIFSSANESREVKENRLRLKDSYRNEISVINKKLSELKIFFTKRINQSENWSDLLVDKNYINCDQYFQNNFWKFPIHIFTYYLCLNEIDRPVLDDSQLDVNSGIRFNLDKKNWTIDFSFFDQVSKRFEEVDKNYSTNLQIATILFIIHEVVHKVHDLDTNTVEGIGNYPRIVEDVDFQADVIAIVSFLFFSLQQPIELINSDEIITKFLEIIKIAIETTFSFNPISETDGLIQIRRANRYLIWIFLYVKIEKLRLESLNVQDTIKLILKIVSTKPIIEISGPSIKSNSAYSRTFYDLNEIVHLEAVAYINQSNNKIIRVGKSENIKFDKLYSGFKNSSFQDLYDFINTIL